MSNHIIIVILFLIWIIFGSFGGVLISRTWDQKWIKSIFFGRSKCKNCNKVLSATELVPLLSFLFQKWKCKNCSYKLSNFYWIVELLSGLVFVATYLFFPYTSFVELLFFLWINRSFLFLMIYDIQTQELHLPMYFFALILSSSFAFLLLDWLIVLKFAIIFVLIFIFIYYFAKLYVWLRFKQKWEWFGLGDVYFSLIAWILFSLVFYYNGVAISILNVANMILIYVVLSSLIWILYFVSIFVKNFKAKKNIAFLPSMILAFWILLLFGDFFINLLQ